MIKPIRINVVEILVRAVLLTLLLLIVFLPILYVITRDAPSPYELHNREVEHLELWKEAEKFPD
jgi:ABC-type sulfate transport system permease component